MTRGWNRKELEFILSSRFNTSLSIGRVNCRIEDGLVYISIFAAFYYCCYQYCCVVAQGKDDPRSGGRHERRETVAVKKGDCDMKESVCTQRERELSNKLIAPHQQQKPCGHVLV